MAVAGLRHLLNVSWLGSAPVAYGPALLLQEALFQRRKNGEIEDTLLLLEHSPVYTVGKRGGEADFLVGREQLEAGGAEVHEVPRGGETTYHGPGQLVIYPVVNLRALGVGPRAYVEGLEDVMIKTLGQYGIASRGRVKCKTGVWVGDRKIGAVGVRISHGITSHGAALNVTTALAAYDPIVPCGTRDKEMTSMERELGCAGSGAAAAALPLRQVADGFAEAFRVHFGYGEAAWVTDLGRLAGGVSPGGTSSAADPKP